MGIVTFLDFRTRISEAGLYTLNKYIVWMADTWGYCERTAASIGRCRWTPSTNTRNMSPNRYFDQPSDNSHTFGDSECLKFWDSVPLDALYDYPEWVPEPVF